MVSNPLLNFEGSSAMLPIDKIKSKTGLAFITALIAHR